VASLTTTMFGRNTQLNCELNTSTLLSLDWIYCASLNGFYVANSYMQVNTVMFPWKLWLSETVLMLRSTYTAYLVCWKERLLIHNEYKKEGTAALTHKPPTYKSRMSHANSSGNAKFLNRSINSGFYATFSHNLESVTEYCSSTKRQCCAVSRCQFPGGGTL